MKTINLTLALLVELLALMLFINACGNAIQKDYATERAASESRQKETNTTLPSYNTAQAEFHYKLGRREDMADRYLQAIDEYKRVLQLCGGGACKKTEANALQSLAVVSFKINDNRQSLEYLDKADKIYSEIEDHWGMIWVLDHRGVFFYLDRNYEIAFSFFSKALDALKKYHIIDAQLEFRLHDHLATTLMRMQGQQHIEEALRHFQEAIALSENVDSYSKAMIRMDFGSALFSIGRFAEAATAVKDSLAWSEPNGYHVLIFHAYRQLGKTSWSVDHNAQQAAAYYDKAINSIEKNAFANKNLNEEARLGLFSDRRIIYEEFLDILAALEISEPSGKWGHKAFEVSERMKSREFLN